MTSVTVLVGAGKHVVLADLRRDTADAAARSSPCRQDSQETPVGCEVFGKAVPKV